MKIAEAGGREACIKVDFKLLTASFLTCPNSGRWYYSLR